MATDQRPRVRLIHTADVHLDDEWNQDLARRAFTAVVDLAIGEQVDVFLLVGDLFDHNRPGPEAVNFALDQLRRLPIPIVMIPGNHDAYDATSIYRRVDFPGEVPNLTFISNVEGETVTLEELHLELWGKALVEHSPEFRPIGHSPVRSNGYWHVGLAHGHFVPDGSDPDRSSPILQREIAASGFDYLALGHWHPVRDVSAGAVRAFYSGSPVPSAPLEKTAGFVAIITLDPEFGVLVDTPRLAL